MKDSSKFISYILFFILAYNNFFKLSSVQANDEELGTAKISASFVSENLSSVANSENKNSLREESNLVASDDLEPSSVEPTNFLDNLDNLNSEVISELVSQNSGDVNEVINNDTPVVSLSDTPTAELQNRANIATVISSQNIEKSFKNTSKDDLKQNKSLEEENIGEEIVKDRSELNLSNQQQTDKIVIEVPIIAQNLSEVKNEEIPSFNEWAQKHLEEVEKKEQLNSSAQGGQNANNSKHGSGAKFRWKNYASLDCGAKVIAANSEAVSPWAILSPSKDEYKLNTCTSRIWFVVELCEAIQVKKIDLANYELFSSSPKDFTVMVSDRFPTRDWSVVGQFIARDEKDVQSFDLDPQIFGKYVKVEIKSHYGSEHYCPLSLFRAYGTSVFEVLQKEDPAHVHRAEDDDDEDDTLDIVTGDPQKNIFVSATDAVINMVKKAAEVLGNKVNNTDRIEDRSNDSTKFSPLINSCTTPSHYVVCNNCSDALYGNIYELLSCKSTQIKNLVSIPFIRKALVNSTTCELFGFNFKRMNSNFSPNYCHKCMNSFFAQKYLGAMCNVVAVMENKIVLNISQKYPNVTENVSSNELADIKTKSPVVLKTETITLPVEENAKEEIIVQPTEPLILETPDVSPKFSCSTDTTYTSQIRPTKALTSNDIGLNKSETMTNTKITEEPKYVNSTETVESQDEEKNTVEPIMEQPLENNVHGETLPETETVTESVETIEDHLEHFISEFNADTNHHAANVPVTTATTPQAQKESVFLRLSNRIKVLERNMSLSSQYLEELSKRYKKQVEDMQRLLEKTLLALHEESKKRDERNKQLEERIENLTTTMEILLNERNSWKSTFCWLFFTCVFGFVLYTYFNRASSPTSTSTDTKEVSEIQRRRSIDGVTYTAPTKKKRRPSDQALKIVASSALNAETEKKQKKRKKKTSLVRSNSIVTLSEESNYDEKFHPKRTSSKIWPPSGKEKKLDWVEGNKNDIEDIPFALEESEHSTLEVLPISKELSKIDAPTFLKTATNARLNRSNSHNGPVVVSEIDFARKSLSAIDGGKKTNSPNLSVNGGVSSGTETEHTPKKERKGLKKLFKNRFLKS